jgi:predicted AlkP superfamily phosphohydrolase/phosphomutase
MENIFKYYEFSNFIKDTSGTFSGNEISFSELNETHFLIFEKYNKTYNLYVSKYRNKKDIAIKSPEIIELLVKDYDKSLPEHRMAIKQYLN